MCPDKWTHYYSNQINGGNMKQSYLVQKGTLEADNSNSPIITEGKELLRKLGFSERHIDFFCERMIAVLNDYSEKFGEGVEIEYIIRKRFGRAQAVIYIPGENYDPFENGNDSRRRKIEKAFALNIYSQDATIDHAYLMGRNIVTGSIPLEKNDKSFFRNPYIWATVLGIVFGFICQALPEAANEFIVENVMNEINKVLLALLSGIMGPVIFISLMSSIIALDSVNDLTNMGFKIFRRFLMVVLFVVFLSIGVSILFFSTFGEGGLDFSPEQIIDMIIGIIPTNVVSPFLENNTPQIVMLAFIGGLALLLLGDKTNKLEEIVHQCNDWIMKIMTLVNKVLPAVPFLSLAIVIGRGDVDTLLKGWKFIAASYIIFTLALVVKAIKLKIVTKVSPFEVFKNMKKAIGVAFATASTTAPLPPMYEGAEKMNIKKDFASFWMPMSTAMLALKTTVNVVVATMMMTEILGLPISLSFLFVLTILATEMSLASPGTVGSWVIAFNAFSISTDYVGLFTAYRLFTINYATAVNIAYNSLELVEAAHKMGELEEKKSIDNATQNI